MVIYNSTDDFTVSAASELYSGLMKNENVKRMENYVNNDYNHFVVN